MSKSSKDPRELLDRYLHAVRFWLPKAHQEDIVVELSEDLHSQVDEKEAVLGRPLDQSEMESILKSCGNPMVVAGRYRPQTWLIGPALFPLYQFVLKVVLLWSMVPVFLLIIGPATIWNASNRFGAVLNTLATLWEAAFTAAAMITLVFAAIERTGHRLKLYDSWSPATLPPVAKPAPGPSRVQSVFELVFGIIGLLWLLAIPQAQFLILGPLAGVLRLAPVWRSFYLPMLLLALAGILRQCVRLVRPQWTWFSPTVRLLITVLSLVLLNSIINVAGHTPSGAWHPYVVVADASHAAQYGKLAGIVNACALLSLAATWLGLCIAAPIETWKLLRQLRKRGRQNQVPVPSRVA